MTMFEILNLNVQACAVELVGYVARFGDWIEKDNNIFGVGAFMEESSRALVVGELSMFMRLFVSPATFVDPLTRW